MENIKKKIKEATSNPNLIKNIKIYKGEDEINTTIILNYEGEIKTEQLENTKVVEVTAGNGRAKIKLTTYEE